MIPRVAFASLRGRGGEGLFFPQMWHFFLLISSSLQITIDPAQIQQPTNEFIFSVEICSACKCLYGYTLFIFHERVAEAE